MRKPMPTKIKLEAPPGSAAVMLCAANDRLDLNDDERRFTIGSFGFHDKNKVLAQIFCVSKL